MQIAVRLCALLLFVSALAFAETWTGKLVDADCSARDEKAACAPTTSSSNFALKVANKTYKFDSEGNRKVAEAFGKSQSGAERSKAPSKADTEVIATVHGTMSNDQISVESVDIQ
jgi:hypothetical protein